MPVVAQETHAGMMRTPSGHVDMHILTSQGIKLGTVLNGVRTRIDTVIVSNPSVVKASIETDSSGGQSVWLQRVGAGSSIVKVYPQPTSAAAYVVILFCPVDVAEENHLRAMIQLIEEMDGALPIPKQSPVPKPESEVPTAPKPKPRPTTQQEPV